MPKVPSGNEHFHLMSEEIFLRSLIEESGHFRKQANPGNSPMMALMFWHSMIALVNHTLSVALRYYRVHRRISSSASVVPYWYVRYYQPTKTKPFTHRLRSTHTHGIVIRDCVSQFTQRCPGPSSGGLYPTPGSFKPANSTFSESADARWHPPPYPRGGILPQVED
jgi:hypothetical protein